MRNTPSPDPAEPVIRRGQPADSKALAGLERECFAPEFRDSPATIRRSLQSPCQEVWLAEQGGKLAGALFLRLNRHSVRIYSVAVNPRIQGHGVGSLLMQLAEDRAARLGKSELVLEANAGNDALINWYLKKGYIKRKLLAGYYTPAVDAWKMSKSLCLRQ